MKQPLPALRALEIQPAHAPDEPPLFAVRDMAQIATQSIAVSLGGYFVMMCLNGESSVADVIRLSEEQFGRPIPAEQVVALIQALDDNFFLHSDRFQAEYDRRAAAFRAAPTRDNRERYPAATELADELARVLAAAEERTVRDAAQLAANLRGIVAPHLDYARGTPCYADAYAVLQAAAPADRYVILGTNHFGHAGEVVATTKSFETPLGVTPCDSTFVQRLSARLNHDLTSHEFDHEQEHSIELQVHLLQALLGARPFEIVPILCPDPSRAVWIGDDAPVGPDARALADVLRAELAHDEKRTVLIASADLSHVGQYFGDEDQTTTEFLDRVGKSDLRLLGMLERRDEEGFVAAVRESQNATRICSVGCIYTLLRALPDAECRVLRYHQAASFEAETTVSCTAAVVG